MTTHPGDSATTDHSSSKGRHSKSLGCRRIGFAMHRLALTGSTTSPSAERRSAQSAERTTDKCGPSEVPGPMVGFPTPSLKAQHLRS